MIDFFKSNTNKSWMRLMGSITIIIALLWGTIEVISSIYIKDFNTHTELILGTLAIGFGGKVWQKKYEQKEEETV